MTQYNCKNCGKESEFDKNMTSCPHCQTDIDGQMLNTLRVEVVPDKGTDTESGGGTITGTGTEGTPLSPDDYLGTASDRTMMAAELGYVDQPVHMKTLELPESELPSVGHGSTAIPLRSVSEGDTNGELRDYKLVSKLGQGSFGVVYRAIQVPLDRPVAIKILKPLPSVPTTEGDQSKNARVDVEERIREEFLREAQFTGKLEHPNIVPIHDIGLVTNGEQSERPFYVMKEIKGISWQDVIREKSRDENMDIFSRVVDAIGFSHSRDILHCDLKPENVMLGEFGEVLVVDWGQAIDMTRPETFRPGGTPAYCSPEMATYWCNFAAQPTKADAAKREIGPRSDVYLLGAMLFQVVTGRPPHFGLKNETPADVMRRASHNEIRRHDAFEGDELLQIALNTLRVNEGFEIVTVPQLQEILKAYESRRQSIELRDRAFELLKEAKASSEYDTYQKAKFGFEESLQLWPENPTANDGLHETRLSCATLALTDQNFDLGLDMLGAPSERQEVELKQKLETGRKKREGRKGMIRILSVLFVLAILGGIAINYGMTQIALQENRKAKAAKEIADKATAQAEIDKADALAANKQAEVAKGNAKIAEGKASQANKDAIKAAGKADAAQAAADIADKEASKARKQAATFQNNAAVAQKKADQATKDAVAATKRVVKAQENVTRLEESSELLRHKSEIAAIAQKTDAGDYQGARELLDQFPQADQSSLDWGRLNLLAHPEITNASLYPHEILHEVAVSNDRSRIAIRFDNRIEIRSSTELGNPVDKLLINDAIAIALSTTGDQIAVAQGASITIFDVASGKPLFDSLNAQSEEIFDLEFSSNDQRLLSVGTPDIKKHSKKQQHELMVWQRAGDQWLQLDNPLFKGAPARPRVAKFSKTGNRIVTSNGTGANTDQLAYVLDFVVEKSGPGFFAWRKPKMKMKSGFLASTFADADGKYVISSFIDRSSSTPVNQIVVWDVDKDLNNDQISSEQFVSFSTVVQDDSYPVFDAKRVVAVQAPVPHLDYQNGILLTAGLDKVIHYWNLPFNTFEDLTLTRSQSSFLGHARRIDTCRILNPGTKFLSVSNGGNPEILLTDVDAFTRPAETLSLAERIRNDQSAPVAIFESTATRRLVVGNDHGLVSLQQLDEQGNTRPLLKWQVAAWETQIVTRQFMFAKTSRDHLFKYDLQTGELLSIITELSMVSKGVATVGKITSLTISENGQTAVLQRANDRQEFEIWDLQKKSNRIVEFGDLTGFKTSSNNTGAVQRIPHLVISSDGKWIAGGEVRFYVWDATTGRNLGSDADLRQQRRILLSALQFVPGTSELVVGQDSRLRTYLIDNGLKQTSEIDKIEGFRAPINQPNVVAVRRIAGQTYALLRKTPKEEPKIEAQEDRDSSLQLVQIDQQNNSLVFKNEIPGFYGCFESDDEILTISRNDDHPLIRFNITTGISQPLKAPATNVQTAGREAFDVNIFSKVFPGASGEFIVQWRQRNKLDPTKRDYFTTSFSRDGSKAGGLTVFANPTIKSIGLVDNIVWTFENGRVRKWKISADGQTITPAGQLPGSFEVFEVATSGGIAVAIESGASTAVVIDLGNNEVKQTSPPFKNGEAITAVTFSDDSHRIGFGSASGTFAVWNLVTNKFDSHGLSESAITQVAFSNDGNTVLTIQAAVGIANILRHSDGNWIAIEIKQKGNDSILAGDISADGNRIVTGSSRGLVTLWNSTSQAKTVGEAAPQDHRELLALRQFQSGVRTIHLTAGDRSVVAFEETPEDNNGLILKTTPR